ncbi:hypothetical protein NJB18091_30160 [Mycobacterium marinum]|uniref:hypothetical protein n=1 Tax=Mycobacterium marinum TaxID=1781 RepID=UPI0021C2D663|nr:hypothetical protein [Mycobacterium marinum]GJN99544.1 hypothetical protein NJB18091_30160 [Mycobacterium marinum]
MKITPIRRDAVQLVRCARHGNSQMRNAILIDYGIQEHDHPLIDLIIHLAYFIHELVEDNPKLDSDWLEIRHGNLVCGPHEDAHRFVQAAWEGNWPEFWKHVQDDYTDDLPDEDTGKHGRNGVEELIWQLAFLGNSVMRTGPECYDNWPEDFYQVHFDLDLGEHDER